MTALPLLAGVGMAGLMLLPGLAWTLWLPPALAHRAYLGPLLGIASAAWATELAYYLGLPVLAAAVFAVVVLPAVLIGLRYRALLAARHDIAAASALYLCCLLGALLFVSLTVWPAAGPWSVDWSSNLDQLVALRDARPLAGWDLARPPLFAAGAVPFLLVFPALPALQVAACAFAAAALVAVYWAMLTLSVARPSPILLLLVGFSAFFIVNLDAIVPKFMQGVLIVSAFVLLLRSERCVSVVAVSALLFGLAVEAHHSTLAYTIGYAVLLWHVARRGGPRLLVLLVACGLVGLAIVVLPEALRIARFGVDQIVRFNPAVALRGTQPAWLVYLLNLESILLGWSYLLPVWNAIKTAHDASPATAGYYLGWLAEAHMNHAANTLLLIVLPFVFTWRRLAGFVGFARQAFPPAVYLGLATAPLINAALHPYAVAAGEVHAGNTAIAVVLLLLGMLWLEQNRALFRGTLLFTVVGGTLPLVIWHVAQSVAVMNAGGALRSGPQLEKDQDWQFLIASKELPWNAGAFPFLTIALLILTPICWVLFARYFERSGSSAAFNASGSGTGREETRST